MSKRRNYESLEIMRHKISMSQSIVEKEGNEDYGKYAGASFEQAEIMTVIDWALEQNMFPKGAIELLTKYRALLEKKRKAHLAVFGSEITKLGFILGSTYVAKSAIK